MSDETTETLGPRRARTFLTQLREKLDDDESTEICWQPGGDGLVVRDRTKVETVWKSFTRTMHAWGFKKGISRRTKRTSQASSLPKQFCWYHEDELFTREDAETGFQLQMAIKYKSKKKGIETEPQSPKHPLAVGSHATSDNTTRTDTTSSDSETSDAKLSPPQLMAEPAWPIKTDFESQGCEHAMGAVSPATTFYTRDRPSGNKRSASRGFLGSEDPYESSMMGPFKSRGARRKSPPYMDLDAKDECELVDDSQNAERSHTPCVVIETSPVSVTTKRQRLCEEKDGCDDEEDRSDEQSISSIREYEKMPNGWIGLCRTARSSIELDDDVDSHFLREICPLLAHGPDLGVASHNGDPAVAPSFPASSSASHHVDGWDNEQAMNRFWAIVKSFLRSHSMDGNNSTENLTGITNAVEDLDFLLRMSRFSSTLTTAPYTRRDSDNMFNIHRIVWEDFRKKVHLPRSDTMVEQKYWLKKKLQDLLSSHFMEEKENRKGDSKASAAAIEALSNQLEGLQRITTGRRRRRKAQQNSNHDDDDDDDDGDDKHNNRDVDRWNADDAFSGSDHDMDEDGNVDKDDDVEHSHVDVNGTNVNANLGRVPSSKDCIQSEAPHKDILNSDGETQERPTLITASGKARVVGDGGDVSDDDNDGLCPCEDTRNDNSVLPTFATLTLEAQPLPSVEESVPFTASRRPDQCLSHRRHDNQLVSSSSGDKDSNQAVDKRMCTRDVEHEDDCEIGKDEGKGNVDLILCSSGGSDMRTPDEDASVEQESSENLTTPAPDAAALPVSSIIRTPICADTPDSSAATRASLPHSEEKGSICMGQPSQDQGIFHVDYKSAGGSHTQHGRFRVYRGVGSNICKIAVDRGNRDYDEEHSDDGNDISVIDFCHDEEDDDDDDDDVFDGVNDENAARAAQTEKISSSQSVLHEDPASEAANGHAEAVLMSRRDTVQLQHGREASSQNSMSPPQPVASSSRFRKGKKLFSLVAGVKKRLRALVPWNKGKPSGDDDPMSLNTGNLHGVILQTKSKLPAGDDNDDNNQENASLVTADTKTNANRPSVPIDDGSTVISGTTFTTMNTNSTVSPSLWMSVRTLQDDCCDTSTVGPSFRGSVSALQEDICEEMVATPSGGSIILPMQFHRRSFAAVALHEEGMIIALGGYDCKNRNILSSVESVSTGASYEDVKSNTQTFQRWTNMKNMRRARHSFGAAMVTMFPSTSAASHPTLVHAVSVPQNPCDCLVVAGGWCDSFQPTKSAELWNFQTNRWMDLPPLQTEREGCAMTSLYTSSNLRGDDYPGECGGRVYVVGGWSGGVYHDTVESLDVSSAAGGVSDSENTGWRYLPSQMKRGRSYCAAVMVQSPDAEAIGDGLDTGENDNDENSSLSGVQLVVVGGFVRDEGATDTAEFYDFCSGQWFDLPPMGTRRTGCAAVAISCGIYVVGGVDEKWNSLATAEYFDFRTYCWTPLTPQMCVPRYGCAAVVIPGVQKDDNQVDDNDAVCHRIVILGGYDTINKTTRSSVEVLDVREPSAPTLSQLPAPSPLSPLIEEEPF